MYTNKYKEYNKNDNNPFFIKRKCTNTLGSYY